MGHIDFCPKSFFCNFQNCSEFLMAYFQLNFFLQRALMSHINNGFFMVSVTMITSLLRGELRGYKILAIMRNDRGQKTIEKKTPIVRTL